MRIYWLRHPSDASKNNTYDNTSVEVGRAAIVFGFARNLTALEDVNNPAPRATARIHWTVSVAELTGRVQLIGTCTNCPVSKFPRYSFSGDPSLVEKFPLQHQCGLSPSIPDPDVVRRYSDAYFGARPVAREKDTPLSLADLDKVSDRLARKMDEAEAARRDRKRGVRG
jgi:hypothetical protein